MKWVILGALTVVIAIAAVAFFEMREANTRKKQTVATESQAALLRYEKRFKPGMSRKDVEDNLRASNTAFFERCCYEDQTTATVVKLADDVPPWYCSELPVYLVLEFSPEPPFDPGRSFGSDVLKHVHLLSQGEGCL
jgi:hypothetical protein